MDDQLSSILSSRQSLYAYPGETRLSNFYPNSNLVHSSVAPASTSSGRQRIAPNTSVLGQLSNFMISSSDILKGLQLNLALTVTPVGAGNTFGLNDGWGYSLPASLEIIMPSSYSAQQTLPGVALFDYTMLCCRSPEEREKTLRAGGTATTFPILGGVKTVHASIPLTAGLFNVNGSGFAIDFSTLSGSLQINIRWNELGTFLSKTVGATVDLATAVLEANITTRSSQIALNSASVRTMLAADPNASYNLPTDYLVTAREVRNLNPTAFQTQVFNLTFAPNAMLNYLIVNVRPTAESDSSGFNVNAYNFKRLFSSKISTLQLTYDSQILFRADSNAEIRRYMQTAFGGDDLSYTTVGNGVIVDNTNLVVGISKFNNLVYAIPLGFNCDLIREKILRENLSSYASSALQLTVGFGGGAGTDTQELEGSAVANPFTTVYGRSTVGAAANYEFTFTCVGASILSLSSGGIEILL